MPSILRILQASAVIGIFTAVVWVVNSNRSPVITGQITYGTNCSLELLEGTPGADEVSAVVCNGTQISWGGGRGHYIFSRSTLAIPISKCLDGTYQGGSRQGTALNGFSTYVRICTNFPGDPNNTPGLVYRVCVGDVCAEPEPECTSNIDCVDFTACTQDKCVNGSCENSAIVCDDSNACTADSCDIDIGCKHVPKNCDDGVTCTTDSCDTATGQCSNIARSCDDNDPCTIDRCSTNELCQHIPRCPGPECPEACKKCENNADCNDREACTTDVCNTQTGKCTNNQCVGAACPSQCVDTPEPCDLIHNPTQCMCEAGAFQGCLAEINCNGNLFVCDDGDDCTQDSCNPVGGECEHVPWAVPIEGCEDSRGGADSGDDGGDTGGSSTSSKGGSSKSSSSRSSFSSSSASSKSASQSSLSESSASSGSSRSSRSSSRSSASSSKSSSVSSASSVSSSQSSRDSSVSSICTIPSGASLVTEWKFEGGNAIYAIDTSGYGHHGELLSGASSTTFASPSPLRGSYALSLDGINDRVRVTRQEGTSFNIPSGTGSRTISIWVRPNEDAGPLLSLGTGTGTSQKFLLQLRTVNGNVILFEDGVNAVNTIQIPKEELPALAGVWNHIAFTVNGSTGGWVYYLNGSLLKEGTFGIPLNTVVNEVEIGSRHDTSTGFFDGAIDDIHMYDRVLSESEIDALNAGCGSSRSSARPSSARSSVSSLRSSRTSSPSSSSRVSSATACMGDECSRGGAEFCGGQGMSCAVTPGLPCIQCIAGSSRSSRSSSPTAAGFCGDGIVQTSLGEDCDMGEGNLPPGTPGGTCSCAPGEDGCTSPIPGLIWFRGCQWPRCGDGEVNNLMLRSTEFVNFDLIREECDDGNFKNGDGCSALCVDELRPAPNSSRSSARSSTAPVCDPDACIDGGDEFCGATGMFCSVTAGLPCIQCALSPSPALTSARPSAKSSARTSAVAAADALPRDQCSSCTTCGTGFANVCDEEECTNLGSCTFQGGIFTNSCSPGPQCQQISSISSASSSRSSARSSVAAAAGFCGDNIVQTSLGEDCDMGEGNLPPGTPGGTCSCPPGDSSCTSPIPGLIWFRGCQWPRCGDGEVNNLMLRSTEFVNFDLIREECDDGNFENGDGCSALCIDESKAFSSRSSVRSSSSSQQTQECSLTVCADGGTDFCSVQNPGSICVRTATLPCMQCVGLPVQSSVASSRISAVSSASRSSLSSSQSSSVSSAPFIARQHGKLSAIVFIDADRDGKLDGNENQRFNGATITVTGVTETGATFMRVSKTGATGALILREIPFSKPKKNRDNDIREADAEDEEEREVEMDIQIEEEISRKASPYYAALTASMLAQVTADDGGYEIILDVPPNYIATTPTTVTVPVTEAQDEQVVNFGIAPAPVSSSTSSLRSSSLSSRSSAASSAFSSQASLPACGGNECLSGGNELCGAQNMRCSPINTDPCVQCLPYSSSSRSSAATSVVAAAPVASAPSIVQTQSSAPVIPVVVPAECKGTECFLGGQEVCAERNLDCVHTDASPCIQCVGVAPSSRTSRSPVRPIGAAPVSPPPFSCSGNECAQSGDVICGARNADCRASNRNPCFTCTARPTSRAASQTSVAAQPLITTCAANECASGGDFFCSLQGFKCSPSNTFPCFTCEALASSRAAVAVRPAATPSQSSRPSIPAIVPAPECVCAAGQRCVDNICLTPVQVTELPPFCGNARLDAGESCDEGSNNTDKPNGYCRRDCTVGRCGDRIVDTPLELCDDGNVFNGDGCSNRCLPERPLTPEEVESRTLPTSIIEFPLQQPQPGQQIVQIPVTPLPASVTPPVTSPQPPATADTGPAAIAVMAAGAAAGYSWMRKKRRS